MTKFHLKDFLRTEGGSIAMILFGSILFFNPDAGSAALSGILGWGMVAAGAFGLLVSILSKPRLSSGAIAVSALILILGIYLLDHPLMLAKVLGIAIGAVLVKQGIGHWMEAKATQRSGGSFVFPLLIAAAIVVIGLRLIFSPMSTSRLFMTLGGAFLVACGIGNILQHRRLRGYLEDRDYDPNIIDADN